MKFSMVGELKPLESQNSDCLGGVFFVDLC
jgi:hypothetical protein